VRNYRRNESGGSVSIRQNALRSFCGPGLTFTQAGRADARVGDLHQLRATAAEGEGDIVQRGSMEAETRRLVMVGTSDAAQLFLGRPLEPFDAKLVEVRNHREHSNMVLLQTKNEIMLDVPGQRSKSYTDPNTVLRLPVGRLPTPDCRAHGMGCSCQPVPP